MIFSPVFIILAHTGTPVGPPRHICANLNFLSPKHRFIREKKEMAPQEPGSIPMGGTLHQCLPSYSHAVRMHIPLKMFLCTSRGRRCDTTLPSHLAADLHGNAKVFSCHSADPQRKSVRVRNTRIIPLLEYDSNVASFSFHPDVKKTKQKKRQPPGHSALRFGGPSLTE